MTVNISGQVPGEAQNGLADIEQRLTQERTPDPFFVIAIVERASLKYNDVKQEWSAVVRFRHIEPLEGAMADEGREVLERAYGLRTGETTLPIALEGVDEAGDDVEDRDVDLDTPLADSDDFDDVGDPFEPEPESAPTLKAVK